MLAAVRTAAASAAPAMARLAGGRSLPTASCVAGSTRAMSSYNTLNLERRGDKEEVALITLNRPKALNALCDELIGELNDATRTLDADEAVGAIVLTGSERAFAAGADISEMATRDYKYTYTKNMFADWADIAQLQTPTIAAVNGFALGGGCELAMTCDIMLAGDRAQFGQPEILLGTIPGCGGTQRLIRAVGKSKAMEMILTGDFIKAEEALACGLVAHVFPADELMDRAVEMGVKISKFSRPITSMAKEAVNAAYEMTLAEGLRFERRLFHSTFATNDQKEGMDAFLNKRDAKFTHT